MSTPRAVLLPLLSVLLVLPSAAAAQRRPTLPDGVLHRTVDIWSEGTRMAGDLYREAFEESGEMALDWFNGCLKD